MRNPFGHGRANQAGPYAGFAPGMLLFLVFAFLPACAVAVFSLTDISGTPNTPWHFIGLDNYRRFFFSGAAGDNLTLVTRTLVFMASVTVIQNAIALFVAVLLNSRLRGETFYRAVIFMPVVLGVTVIGLIWSLVLDPTGGPASALLGAFDASSAFLGDTTLAFPLVIGVQIWSALGYSMVIFLAGLQAIPHELYEAATVDGTGAWQRFRYVTFPLLAPAVNANVLIAIIGSLQTYQLVWVLTGGRSDTSVLALEVFLQSFGIEKTIGPQPGYGSALSMIQFGLIAVVSLAALGWMRRREVQL